jgi:sugar O-acyltransferase (sialic acid O-acetyltransferase NeuD family)
MINPYRIILVGAFPELIELCAAAGVAIAALIENRAGAETCGLAVNGGDADAPAILAAHPSIPIHITPDGPALRARLVAQYLALGARLATLVHPRGFVAPSAVLGEGSVVHAGAMVSSSSRLGRAVKLNGGANVTHDVELGDFVSIAPGAVVLSRCRVAEEVYIGGNATVLPGRSIGARAVVGAGCVVTRDVPECAVVVGVPGRLR